MDFRTELDARRTAWPHLLRRLAAVADVSRSTVYRWIDGQPVPAEKRAAVARVMDRSVEELWPS